MPGDRTRDDTDVDAPTQAPSSDVAVPPTQAPNLATQNTIATQPGAAGSTPAPIVVAAQQEDYGALTAVDPRHYVMGRELAKGGMGRITAARDRRLGRPVAIKELLAPSPDLARRFEREARITARLQHP